ncbi:MAG TPA: hypothetical protein PKY12_16295, partial [Catalimonadaceae bacterium]|nr:hypothetical protein [Catalimonadaceae bacterium]
RNLGPGVASGSTQNLLRVSKAINFDPETDSELGIKVTDLNLSSNGTRTVSFRGRAEGILPGAYRALGQVNSKFNLVETNLLNNNALSASNVSVNVNTLPLGQIRQETDLETNEISYHKLTTTQGLDLKITFTGAQAFASFGKVPTYSVADFRPRKTGFTTNFVIPSTQAGDYYIGLTPENLGGNLTTEILVLAKSFGVETVSPSLVGAGKVSTYISGAGFDGGTIFEAFRGTTLIATGTILEISNSMEARVKWDFTGQADGPCTIKVRKDGVTGASTGSLVLEPIRLPRLLSERTGKDKVRGNGAILQIIRYFNDGNVDIEYGMGLTSFPGFATAKSISTSEGSFLLGDIHSMAG